MPKVEFTDEELGLIRETLTYYEDRVRNYPYNVPEAEREAERQRRRTALDKSAAIRYRITAALNGPRKRKA
jgi:hypothetical protein